MYSLLPPNTPIYPRIETYFDTVINDYILPSQIHIMRIIALQIPSNRLLHILNLASIFLVMHPKFQKNCLFDTSFPISMDLTVLCVNSNKRLGNSKTTHGLFFFFTSCLWLTSEVTIRKHSALAGPTRIQDDKENCGLQRVQHLHNFGQCTNKRASVFVNTEKTRGSAKMK